MVKKEWNGLFCGCGGLICVFVWVSIMCISLWWCESGIFLLNLRCRKCLLEVISWVGIEIVLDCRISLIFLMLFFRW